MKTKKTFEIEIQRNNVTPAQFLAYVRSRVDSKSGEMLRSDLNLRYFAAGDDLNFDTHHEEPGLYGVHEKSISRPYEMQTFVRYPNGATYNEICEFVFDDEKTGHGYYYLLNVEAVEETEEAGENAEETTTTETAETVEETETATTEATEADESSETETADGTASTSESTVAERTGANERDRHERQREPDNGGENTLSAFSAITPHAARRRTPHTPHTTLHYGGNNNA